MADHVRTQIRDAAATLITGLTTTGSNVYNARALALAAKVNLPCWVVQVGSEQLPPDVRTTDGKLQRLAELEFIGYCRATTGEGTEDTLDQMLKELEVAFDSDRKLGGLLKDSRLVEIEPDDAEDDASQMLDAIRVVYVVEYWTARNAPDVTL